MSDIETKVSYWHPRFHYYDLLPDTVLLLGEKESYHLAGPSHQAIIELVQTPKSLKDVIQQHKHLGQTALLYQVISHFLEKKILTQHPDEKRLFREPISTIPDPITYKNFRIYQTSHFPKALALVENLKTTFPLSLIFTDDYLIPTLAKINRQHLSGNTPVLLLKLTGQRFFVGPYLSMQKGTPCGQCLASQMLKNQPVRKWLQTRQKTNYISFPVLVDEQALVYEKIIPIIQQAIAEPHTLFEVDPQDFRVQRHIVNHRPQCNVCGNTHLMKKQMSLPFTLSTSLKNAYNDGGSRTIKPEKTMHSLQRLISPLTGTITNLMELPSTINDPIKTYRTAFFKTPPTHKTIDNQDFVQSSLGKGISTTQSQVSALCESIERYAAQYQGDEPIIRAKASQLAQRHYLPQHLADFSEKQYQYFNSGNYPSNEKDHVVTKYSTNEPLHWAPAWSLTHQEKVYVPFTYCFANTPFAQDEEYIRWGSNGCAAGNTLEEAVLQGFYELIERDATAIWWYNKVERQRVNLDELAPENLQKIHQTLGKEWNYWVLDISHDLEIPVMAGVSQHKKTGKFCLGFGCHLNPVIACQRALTELCQLIPIREQHSAPFDFDAIEAESFLLPQGQKPLDTFVIKEHQAIKNDILVCIDKAQQIGLEILAVNYSRPDLPIKTVKMIVPGLCHIWPQLGAHRLYYVPVKMGWLATSKKEEALNQLALYI